MKVKKLFLVILTTGSVLASGRLARSAEDAKPQAILLWPNGAPGGVGFISSVSQAFCSTCNRIRLTAEGGLRTCLFSLHETPLRDLIRSGASDDTIAGVIESAVWAKEEGGALQIGTAGYIKPEKSMSQIGG